MKKIVRLVAIIAALVGCGASAEAQQAKKMARIGVLRPGSPGDPMVESFRQGLRDLGYVEGQNIAVEYRWAEEKLERLSDLAAELVRLKVEVMLAGSTPSVRAAQKATKTTPIVMAAGIDPVEAGVIQSFARPGGNVTGLTIMSPELSGKRLELLKETIPGISRVAVLWISTNPVTAPQMRETKAAAQALGLELQPLDVRDPKQFDSAFQAATRDRAGALMVLQEAVTFRHRTRIVGLAARSRLPVMYGFGEFVKVGGLMAYGASNHDNFRRAAVYVDKILKGAKPADLPVEQPTSFELAINLKAAQALGLMIPPTLLLQADEVIK